MQAFGFCHHLSSVHVCLRHECIVTKALKLGVCGLYRFITGSLTTNSRRSTRIGGSIWMGLSWINKINFVHVFCVFRCEAYRPTCMEQPLFSSPSTWHGFYHLRQRRLARCPIAVVLSSQNSVSARYWNLCAFASWLQFRCSWITKQRSGRRRPLKAEGLWKL